MKILLLIALVIVGSSQILARPGLRWWFDDSVAYSEDYDPSVYGETDDYVDVEKSLKDYDGFEDYWSRPINELYVAETDSTQEMDTSSKEMPSNEGKEYKDDKNEYVIVDKDVPPNDVDNINFSISKNVVNVKNLNDNLYDLARKSLLADDLKFVAKEEISRVNEPLNSNNYFAYQVREKKEEGTGIKDNSDSDKGVLSSSHIDLIKDDEHTNFVFIEDKQNESDVKDVMSSGHKDFKKDDELVSAVDRKLYRHGYPPVMEQFSHSDWNNGEEFVFIEDKEALQDEEDMPKEQYEGDNEDDEEVEEDKAVEIVEEHEEGEDDEQDKENEQKEKGKKDKEDNEDDGDKEAKVDTGNEEKTESRVTESSDMGITIFTHLDLSKDLPSSSVARPFDFLNNYGKFLSQFTISAFDIQDFLMTQEHLNSALKVLNVQNEMIFKNFFSTTNERNDYNGQLYRGTEREVTEMLQTVDQINERIIQMQQIEQKHNYHMLLDALLLELNGKSK